MSQFLKKLFTIKMLTHKFSLRSKYDVLNVAEFAKDHEGGGHALASGCIYHGKIDAIEKIFEKDMAEFIESKESGK